VSEDGHHVLAFRGTKAKRDWVTNISGTLAKYESSPFYAQVKAAVKIARETSTQYPDLVIVGHSMGGRLAQVASLETGARAVAFDRAPFGAVELLKWPKLASATPLEISRFRGWADPLTTINPFAHGDTVVSNIVKSENGEDYVYGHSADLLALAMQDVRVAWNEGWLSAEQTTTRPAGGEEGARPAAWRDEPAVKSAIAELMENGTPRAATVCQRYYGPLTEQQNASLLIDYLGNLQSKVGKKVYNEQVYLTPDKFFGAAFNYSKVPSHDDIYYCASGEHDFLIQSMFGGTRFLDALARPKRPDFVSGRISEAYDKSATKWLSNADNTCRFQVPASSSATSLKWSGACNASVPSGAGILDLYNRDVLIDSLLVGEDWGMALKDGALWYDINLDDFDFTLAKCDAFPFSRGVRIDPKQIDRDSYFSNSGIVQLLFKRAAMLAVEQCPAKRHAFSNIRIWITSVEGLAPVATGYTDASEDYKLARYSNSAANKWREEIKRRERERQAEIEKQKQAARAVWIAQEKLRVSEAKRQAEIASIMSWETSLSSKAPWTNMADLFQYDPAKTASILSDGHKIVFEVSEISFLDGNVVATGEQGFTDIYEGIERPALDQIQDDFSWDLWNKALAESVENFAPRKYTYSCKLAPKQAAGVKQGSSYVFTAKLIQLANEHAVFDCKLEGPA